jgi:hypothetical protein
MSVKYSRTAEPLAATKFPGGLLLATGLLLTLLATILGFLAKPRSVHYFAPLQQILEPNPSDT